MNLKNIIKNLTPPILWKAGIYIFANYTKVNTKRIKPVTSAQQDLDMYWDPKMAEVLEHFTEKGIKAFIAENHRVAKFASFHMIPVSRSGKNEGWMKTVQSFHNNSVEWWIEKYKLSYETVYVFDSAWEDEISLGKWFICIKEVRS